MKPLIDRRIVRSLVALLGDASSDRKLAHASVSHAVTQLQNMGVVPRELESLAVLQHGLVEGSDDCVRWYAGQLLHCLSDDRLWHVVGGLLELCDRMCPLSPRTCFVSGHMDLTKEEFAARYEGPIRAAWADGARFVVGDAIGCDFMAQRLLHSLHAGDDRSTGRVRVFHMLERPRHSFGSGYGSNDPGLPKEAWEGRRGGFPLVGGFASDEERDAAMTASSSEDIAWVRPEKNKRNSGTARNIRRRQDQAKARQDAERVTWPVFNVDLHHDGDNGESYVHISPTGDGFGDDVRLPQDMADELDLAWEAVAKARSRVRRAEEAIRRVVKGDQR